MGQFCGFSGSGLSRDCSQDVHQGCSHLKAQLGENVPPSSLMRLLDWGPQVLTSFRSKTSVTCFMGLPTGQLTTWALAFCRVKEKREHPIKKSPFPCNLISEVTSYHLLHILLIRGKLLGLAHTQGEGIIQGRTTKRQWVKSSYRNYHSQTSLKPDMAMWLNSS